MKHTPGPWQCQPDKIEDGFEIWARVQLDRDAVISVTGGHDCRIPPDEDEANARLIAAAPDLLVMLEEAVAAAAAQGRAGGPAEEFWRQRVAKWGFVIAKATEGEPTK